MREKNPKCSKVLRLILDYKALISKKKNNQTKNQRNTRPIKEKQKQHQNKEKKPKQKKPSQTKKPPANHLHPSSVLVEVCSFHNISENSDRVRASSSQRKQSAPGFLEKSDLHVACNLHSGNYGQTSCRTDS